MRVIKPTAQSKYEAEYANVDFDWKKMDWKKMEKRRRKKRGDKEQNEKNKNYFLRMICEKKKKKKLETHLNRGSPHKRMLVSPQNTWAENTSCRC